MRTIDTGKNCFFLLGILLSAQAMSQSPYVNNPSTKKPANSKTPTVDTGNGPQTVMSFDNPNLPNLEPDFDASSRAQVKTEPSDRAAVGLAFDTSVPSYVIDKASNSVQTLRFNRANVSLGLLVSYLAHPFFTSGGINVRYRLGVGVSGLERNTPTNDSFGTTRNDRQTLTLVPVPLELEASHRYNVGLTPLVALGVIPTVTVASESLLQDSKVGLGMTYRAAIGARQEFLGSNSLMLELGWNWNNILSQSPNGLGVRVGYQRAL